MPKARGHSLLEAIVAASIFVVVAIFLTTIWALYDSALTKSATRLAANHVARSVAEGCIANGYDWLVANPNGSGSIELSRRVRSRSGKTTFEFEWEALENNGSPQIIPDLSPQLSKLTVTVSWHRDGTNCVLEVRDQGIGIDRRHLPRLTERFYRVEDSRASSTGGTGLGLAIVKHVAASHGARLEISSELGKGSVFSLVFGPQTQVAATAGKASAAPAG